MKKQNAYERNLEFSKQFDNIDLDMIYVHNIAHHTDRNIDLISALKDICLYY